MKIPVTFSIDQGIADTLQPEKCEIQKTFDQLSAKCKHLKCAWKVLWENLKLGAQMPKGGSGLATI